MPARLRLGCQGWNYPAWVGPFYPVGTRPVDFLSRYARAFDTVEVDSTFYAIPPESSVRGWAHRVHDGFRFSLKLPQEITHQRRFIDTAPLEAEFFARVRLLGEKLGSILVQLGPDFSPVERDALVAFLARRPGDLDLAVEFRQREWMTPDTLAMLRDHAVALCLSDARWIPRKWMLAACERPTADHTYVRWMGPDRSITDYSRVQFDRTQELTAWAEALPAILERVRVAYGYVNNHFSGHSPANVRTLQAALGQRVVDPSSLDDQIALL
ncbi:MAG: DUF72 domain-containing protein [Gemmatimonadaceae bacterium]|jgi:uncharacterized protein YecE (DUF72 family)|nr:DUF72 domain-containing protein [Gemmatimonadaceae bacterium]